MNKFRALLLLLALAFSPFSWSGTGEELIYAIRAGDLEQVKALVERGADVSSVALPRQSPLSVASNRGHIEIVRFLVERGAEVNVLVGNGTALSLALNKGYFDIARYLLDKGADPNLFIASGEWGDVSRAPLYIVVVHHDNDQGVEMMRLLLEKGADPNKPIVEYESLLDILCTSYSSQLPTALDDSVPDSRLHIRAKEMVPIMEIKFKELLAAGTQYIWFKPGPTNFRYKTLDDIHERYHVCPGILGD